MPPTRGMSTASGGSALPTSRHGVSDELFERMVALRRDLHRHPELSGEEEWTAARLSRELDGVGLRHRTGVGGHGVVADVPGEAAGPVVALRADIDALPIQEETGLPFASQCPGVMHACGHDGHASLLVGAAALLAEGPRPPAPVRLIWQPAEERSFGAASMIEDGVLDGVRMIFAGHLDRHYPAGVLAISNGAVNASSDHFIIDISGKGGHGARPHEALDAVVTGSLLVTALQTIVSREVDPSHPSVISVGRFDAGSAHNVIAASARLEGTVRAQEREVREHLLGAVERIARAVGALHGARMDVRVLRGTPPVVNTAEMARLARQAARETLGPASAVPLHRPNMGGEDFGCYLEHVRGCYVRFGARPAGSDGFPAHSSRFDFDEAALAAGAAWMAAVARLAGARLRDEADA